MPSHMAVEAAAALDQVVAKSGSNPAEGADLAQRRDAMNKDKYVVGATDWYGSQLPAVVNSETGLTSKAMSRTIAERWCLFLNYQEFHSREGASIDLRCDVARMLRRLHGLPEGSP